MLLDIRCESIPSIGCHLTYDDGTVKDRVIALNDLISVDYNGNGMRKHIIGRVAAISTVGTDQHAWYIIVDGSDDFATQRARFSPLSILDVEILRKADQDQMVKTTLDQYATPYIRIVKGRLQYSLDGYEWRAIKVDETDIIEPQEGTVPIGPGTRPPAPIDEDDGIEDAVY